MKQKPAAQESFGRSPKTDRSSLFIGKIYPQEMLSGCAPPGAVLYFFIDCLCIRVLPRNRAIHDRLAHCLVLQATPTLR